MNPDEMKAIVSYRLERAAESLQAAEIMRQNGMLTFAMNRVYYAMFYAVQSLLITGNAAFSKHGQVKGHFNRAFIKTEIFPINMGRIYNRAFEYRQKFDYLDFAQPDEETVRQFINHAREFVSVIQSYLGEKIPGTMPDK